MNKSNLESPENYYEHHYHKQSPLISRFLVAHELKELKEKIIMMHAIIYASPLILKIVVLRFDYFRLFGKSFHCSI
jgi:hypothetical protein